MSIIYLALGSNLGDRLHYIEKAVRGLEAAGIKVVKRSSVMETDPQDAPAQGRFLNCVVKAETDYPPQELLSVIQDVERGLGRRRKVFRGPRVIDIDILLIDDIKLATPRLLIPHPRMLGRSFVMEPLQEIDPDLCASLKP